MFQLLSKFKVMLGCSILIISIAMIAGCGSTEKEVKTQVGQIIDEVFKYNMFPISGVAAIGGEIRLSTGSQNLDYHTIKWIFDDTVLTLKEENSALERVFTSQHVGTFKVTVQTHANNNLMETHEFKIKFVDSSDFVILEQLKIEGKMPIQVGTIFSLNPGNIYSADKIGEIFSWISSDDGIATIDEYGSVLGVSEGDATITVSLKRDPTIKVEIDFIITDELNYTEIGTLLDAVKKAFQAIFNTDFPRYDTDFNAKLSGTSASYKTFDGADANFELYTFGESSKYKEWVYTHDTKISGVTESEIYIQDGFGNMTGHYKYAVTAISDQVFRKTISDLNVTYIFHQPDFRLEIVTGTIIDTSDSTKSVTFIIEIEFDADNDGTNETYSVALNVPDMDPSDIDKTVLVEVKNSNNAFVGDFILYPNKP
ncbi:MAG: Ig-like domain-containing protein [Candidatus Margulisbacteria bacterium]|nr:Ig-like domain-containing protein [Candidatus Margulisiibacteriota bacterium]